MAFAVPAFRFGQKNILAFALKKRCILVRGFTTEFMVELGRAELASGEPQ
jgi:hypothetical protein